MVFLFFSRSHRQAYIDNSGKMLRGRKIRRAEVPCDSVEKKKSRPCFL